LAARGDKGYQRAMRYPVIRSLACVLFVGAWVCASTASAQEDASDDVATAEPILPVASTRPMGGADAAVAPRASASAAPVRAKVLIPYGIGPAPENVQRETPREALEGYSGVCREDFDTAHYLGFQPLTTRTQKSRASELAHCLYSVLDRQVWLDLVISNDACGRHRTHL
jgi:hypothetical protein